MGEAASYMASVDSLLALVHIVACSRGRRSESCIAHTLVAPDGVVANRIALRRRGKTR